MRNICYLIGILIFFYGNLSHAEEKKCSSDNLMLVKGNVELKGGCVYEAQVVINQSNTHLDCKGAQFKGRSGWKIGLLIDSKGKELKNISIKNCRFYGFESSGIRVTWDVIDSRKGDDRDAIYAKTPRDISISNVTVEKSGRVGIYIDDYVQDLTVADSVISDSGAVGIYLEHSTQRINIINNQIVNNGYGGRVNREGLAIDSSAHNKVIGNVFKSNNAGGIFLYKNCGENIDSGKQVVRWQHSDFNIIKNNYFENEKIGVWLASRQERDLRGMKCGDPVLNSRGWYADFADNNVLDDNQFCQTEKNVIDKGRSNSVSGSVNFCRDK